MLWTVCDTLENCDYAYVEISEAFNRSTKCKLYRIGIISQDSFAAVVFKWF